MRLHTQAWHTKGSGPVAAAWVFAIFLVAVVAVEFGIMLILPRLIPRAASETQTAILDATILAVILAPLAWLGFVRPLRKLSATRGKLLEQLLASQEAERRRLAADLQDGLGQNLTTVLLRLKVIEDTAQVPAVLENAAALREIVADSLAEIRRMVRNARPPVLDDLGLAAALERQLEEVAAATGITGGVTWHGAAARLPESVETVVYRVVQEAVTNAARHAAAGRIDVSIDCQRDFVVATVEDDGRGFDVRLALRPERHPFGLLSMRERAASLGGSIDVASGSGGGTRVRMTLPLRDERAAT